MNQTTVRPTAAQRSIYLDEMLNPDAVLHTMGDCLEVSGPLDVGHLLDAVRQLVVEADVLRVRFIEQDGVPLQVIAPPGDPGCLVPDLVDLEPAGDDAELLAAEQMQADLQRPFDLTGSALARGTVYRLAPERHWVYVAMHHVLCDGFSRVPLYNRLAELYRANVCGVSPGPALPALAVLVSAEDAYLESTARERDQRYWTAVASDLPDPLSLSGQAPVAARHHLRRTAVLPREQALMLRSAATAAGVTWAVFAVAAVSAFAAKATGRASSMVTLPVTARTSAKARRVPGMVANYLPVAAQVGPRVTRGELLETVSGQVLGALRHQLFRGEQVRRMAGLDVADRRPFGPYVNVLPQPPVLDLGRARARLVNLATGIVDDLMVTFLDGAEESLEVHLNGNPALYTEVELEECLASLLGFLTEFADADDDTRLGRLRLPPTNTIDPGQGPRFDLPYIGVVERFIDRVGLRGDAAAVKDAEGELTYAELAARAGAAAGEVGDAAVVALVTRPGRDLVAGVLGALVAGAAFTPLDPRAPALHNAGLLADSGAELVLVDSVTRAAAEAAIEALPEGAARPRCVDINRIEAAPMPFLPRGAPSDPAYVVFTSGTTGKPKGAIVRREGLMNHLLAKVDLLGLGPASTVVQNAPATFDVSIWQMLAPLVVGGTVRVVTPDQAADPEALAAIVAADGVTVLEVVPSLLGAALKLWDEHDHARLSGLDYLMVTGETLPAPVCTDWLRHHPDIPVINAYGPTECSDDVTHAVVRALPAAGRPVPIGEPVRNTRLLVLGPDLGPVPPGQMGELYVTGDCLGVGYLGDPAKTAVRFVADPSGPSGARLYRTGDHVRWRPDGQLEFLGRTDHQVKIRGQRVEVGGIEASVRELPGVEDAVVLAAPDAQGSTALAAWVRGPGATAVDLPALADRLAGVLPAHMLPRRWAAVDSFPLTAHGKVDRAAVSKLPCPVLDPPGASPSSPEAGGDGDPGRSAALLGESVRSLQAAFAEVLRVDTVGSDDDFFTLGGDSIGAIGLSARARATGLPLTPQQVFEHRTPAALARLFGDAPTPPSPTTPRGAGPTSVVEPTPIIHQLAEDCPQLDGPVAPYAQVSRLRSPVPLDTNGAVTLLAELVSGHPGLRTRFDELAPGVWHADREVDLVVGDVAERLTVLGPDDDLAVAVHEAAARLEPRAGRVWQAVLEAGPPSRLTLVIHHLCVDGVSWRIIREDLDGLTSDVVGDPGQSARRHRPPGDPDRSVPALPAEGTSFAEWSAALGRLARSADFVMAERPVWEPLTGRATRRLFGPLDRERHTFGSSRQLHLELPPDLTTSVLALPKAYRADLNDVLLGALAVALHGQVPTDSGPTGTGDRLLVELEGHGREQLRPSDGLDVTRTVGWFTSVFPVALNAPAGAVAAVKDVHHQLRGLPRHGLGHGMLRWLHPRGSRLVPDLPTPEVGFNYLGRFDGPGGDGWDFDTLPTQADVPGGDPKAHVQWVHGSLGTVADPRMPVRHAVSLTASTENRPGGPALVAHWTWVPDLVEDRLVEHLGRAWFEALALLVSMQEEPDAAAPTPSDLPLVAIDEAELAELRDVDGDPLLDVLPLTPVQRGMFLHSRFEDGRPDPYVLQVATDVDGPLDAGRLSDACGVLFHDHPVLGAEVHLPAQGEPLLVVRQRGALPVKSDDLGDLPGGDVERLAAELAREDRERPFDLGRGPSVRCRVLRLGAGRHRVVLTLHHMLVDGWSMPLVVGRLLEAYDQRTAPEGRPELRSAYADYLNWVSRQDVGAGRAAWSDHLDGLNRPTVVTGGTGAGAAPTGSHRVRCTDDVTTRLTALAHHHAATVSTVVLVAWAAVLARLSGRSDVLFGLVVSTRPPELPGVDRAVGLLLNTVPVRVRAGAGEDVGVVLRRTQQEQLALTPFRHLGTAEIFASCPELRDGGDPFDTVVVIENFPFESTQGRQVAGLRLGGTTVVDSRHHPVSLVVEPGVSRLSLRLDVGAGPGQAGLVGEMGAHLEEALGQLADGLLPSALTAEPTTPAEQGPLLVAESGPTSRRTASTPLESAVARAFASVLGLGEEPVDVDASFFALGGDSIAAIRLAGLLRGQGLRVGPREVFESRTPAAIAAAAGTGALPLDDATHRDDPFDELLDDPFALTLDELAELDEELGLGGAPR